MSRPRDWYNMSTDERRAWEANQREIDDARDSAEEAQRSAERASYEAARAKRDAREARSILAEREQELIDLAEAAEARAAALAKDVDYLIEVARVAITKMTKRPDLPEWLALCEILSLDPAFLPADGGTTP